MQWDHEIVIVGGGMVGAALAAKLGQAGMSVGLVERASAPTPPSGDYDLRISSLNARSLAFVKASGAVLPGERCCRARGRTMCPARPQSLPWTPLPVPRRPRRTRTGPQQHRQVHPAGVVTACPAGSRPVAAAPLAGLVARLLPGQAGSRTDH